MKKKITIFVQLMIVMIALVIGTVGIGWILNNTMLQRFYYSDKQKSLVAAYDEFNISFDASNFDITFGRICDTKNLHAYINCQTYALCYGANAELMQYQFMEIVRSDLQSEQEYLATTDKFRIIKNADSRNGLEYMILYGTLNNGDPVMIRTPLESVDETISLTNRFFAICTLVSIGIGLCVVAWLAKIISKPIVRLNEISLKMSALDFNAKYEDRKQHAKEISQLGHNINAMSESLESKIAELKEANAELQKDIQKKEEIDSMRKEFLSNVSHELKTPLALISGYAEGLQDGITEDPESRAYYCSVIIDEAERMNKMVKQLLNLNQLEFGNSQIDVTRFDMTELILGVLSVNQLVLEQNGIKVEFDQTQKVEVWADQFQTEQIITNFLTNAIHYVDENKLIRISYVLQDGILRVSVFNSGSQIPEEATERVWEKFYKVDKARTREYGGSGIGLSIVKAIVMAHGQQCGVLNHTDGVEFWAEFDASLEK